MTADGSTTGATSTTDVPTGGADECVDIDDCSVAEPACRTVTACVAGRCVFADMPEGTAVPDPEPNDCAALVCDGAGGTVPAAAPSVPCYTGPAGTIGVGSCAAGTQMCGPDGEPTGACEAEVVPAAEACEGDAVDSDCDGALDDAGACTCGDGVVSRGEACDDGNTADDDACSSTCTQQGVLQYALGTYTGCALITGGHVKCWGMNVAGALGYGDVVDRGHDPEDMGAGLPIVDLGAGITATAITGGTHTQCALLSDSRVKCWGSGDFGALGSGDEVYRGDGPGEMGDALPFVDLGQGLTVAEIGAFSSSACAVFTDGRLKCWGGNGEGKLGLGDTANRGDEPGEMGDALPFVDLGAGQKVAALASSGQASGGRGTTCAILESGALKCWGENNWGRLGLGDTEARGDEPGEMGDALPTVDLGQGLTARRVGIGSQHACALLSNDRVRCWGAREYIGNSDDITTRGDEPGEMGDNLPFLDFGAVDTAVDLAVGTAFSCVLLTSGDIKCWGINHAGHLGLGDVKDRGDMPGEMGDALPAVDLGSATALSLRTGGGHTCFQATTGALRCWGNNASGQVGAGKPHNIGTNPDHMGDNLAIVRLYNDGW